MALANAKRKRGSVRTSITRHNTRLKSIEHDDPITVLNAAKQIETKLSNLDEQFKATHFEVIENIEEDKLDEEQKALDNHDDLIADMSTRVFRLISAAKALKDPTRASTRRLARLKQTMSDTKDAIDALADSAESALLEQYNEKLADYKSELADVYSQLIDIDIPDDHDLFQAHAALKEVLFQSSLTIKSLYSSRPPVVPAALPTPPPASAVRLPKLEVPTFDGNILLWKKFWEQFTVSVHDHAHLSNAEKLVYLQQAIKDGAASSAIEGLSKTGDQYDEAVECLQSRYDRPRLIHREHVRLIMNATPLRDGSGKELRRLHDTIQQHTRALKGMGSEPELFLTSVIELKLDRDTMFEWQKHTQAKNKTPHYDEILSFIDLRAQASETTQPLRKPIQQKLQPNPSPKIPAFAAFSSPKSHSYCILCDKEKHALYHCPKFKSLSHDDKFSTLRKHNLCLNCFGHGHLARQCKSDHRCRKCQRPHHSLLHSDAAIHVPSPDASGNTPNPAAPPFKHSHVTSNAAIKLRSSPLLMTCKVLVTAPDGLTIEA